MTDEEELMGKVFAHDIINMETGEIIFDCNEEIDRRSSIALRALDREVKILFIDSLVAGPYLRDTLAADKMETQDEAILEIYRRLRPGDPSTVHTAKTYFNNLFFNEERYDLSEVGRVKLNHKLHKGDEVEGTVLTKGDIVETVRYFIELKNARPNSRSTTSTTSVTAVSARLASCWRISIASVLVRMERAIKERMSMSQEIETLMPHDLDQRKAR